MRKYRYVISITVDSYTFTKDYYDIEEAFEYIRRTEKDSGVDKIVIYRGEVAELGYFKGVVE